MGIGYKLVQQMEQWFKRMGAEYSYMATDKDNLPSIHLFTARCGYLKFRTPSVLVHPVYAHRLPISHGLKVLRLNITESESLYRQKFATTEFFPRDIDSILKNPLSLGTFLAVQSNYQWQGLSEFLKNPPESWAVMSVWNSKAVFRLEVKGASKFNKGLAWASRFVDRAMPWFRIPSVPDLFSPFGFYFLYGLGGQGPIAKELIKGLCRYAHNLARVGGCGVVATEVAGCDPLRDGIPHWEWLSCNGDLWCVKRIAEDYGDGSIGDWTKSVPGTSIFVDPREF